MARPRDDAPATRAGSKGQATRAKLVAAGVTVFARRGLQATRVDDIVSEARTSHGTFYLYFSSKEELFDQLVAEVADEFAKLTDVLPEIRATPDSRAALEQWLIELIGVYEQFGPVIRSWTESDRSLSDGGGIDVLGLLATSLASRVKVRRRKDLDPEIAALALFAMFERVNYFVITAQLDATREQLARTLADIALDAFFGVDADTGS